MCGSCGSFRRVRCWVFWKVGSRLTSLHRVVTKLGRTVGHNEIVAALGMEILSGARPPGSRMPSSDELNERFGVSRVLLREVTKTLAAKGMIAAKTRVGTLVLPPENWNWFDPEVLSWRARLGLDLDFVGELTELRRSVEPMAAALAAQRRTPEQMKAIRDALGQMAEAGPDRRAFAEADINFHIAIASASGNSLFRSVASVIETALTAYFSLSTPIDLLEMQQIIRRHEVIADAIESSDAKAAVRAMTGVIDEGMNRAVTGAHG